MRRYLPIDVLNVMMNRTPNIRACRWSSSILDLAPSSPVSVSLEATP
jgi:hypothetical protein